MKWPIVEIETIKASERNALVGGPFGSDLTSKSYVEDGVPVIRGNNLPDHTTFHDGDFVFVSDEKALSLSANTAVPRDLVFTQRGTLGQVGLIPDLPNFPRYVISQSQMKLTVDASKAEPRFVYYYFRLPTTVETIKSHVSSSGVPHINLGVLRHFKIPLPPLKDQRRIIEVAAAYDDLIENNRRRMALLEESARLLYREWFIHLRFAGHEHTRLINGVPKDWESKVLSDICTDIRESVSPDELEAETPYIGLEHIPRRSISLTEWGTAESVTSSKSRFVAGDILFGKIRPYFHKVGIAFLDGVASSDAIVIRPYEERLLSLTLMTVSSDDFVAEASQSAREGSKMPRADWKLMLKYPVLVPPRALLNSFNESVTAVTAQLKNLCFQTQKLRTARDLLLPRLMSGELTP